MRSTTSYEYGDVVLVWFWHTDGQRQEKRPAVVVSANAHNRQHPDVVLAAVTSQTHHAADANAVEIPEWEAAGLHKPSVVKPILFSYEQDEVLKKLGRIGPETAKQIKLALGRILGFTPRPR